MPNKEFLETYPLYKKLKNVHKYDKRYAHTWLTRIKINKPAIHMHCKICESEQTFNMSHDFYWDGTGQNEPIHGHVQEIRYLCSSCQQGFYVFLVNFGYEIIDDNIRSIYLEKVGQIPPWSIAIDKDLENLLGKNAKYYKNGLICESQGYGIAAHAYYRRIVEDIIDELLESIAEHISGKDELIHYNETLEKVKTTRVAQEKIELVKDLLPSSLQPNKINPLQVIYDALSEGIHYNSDEDCLESADAIRISITYLANEIMKKKRDHENFTESMKKILDKKSKQKSQ